jgi:hypothetical protein
VFTDVQQKKASVIGRDKEIRMIGWRDWICAIAEKGGKSVDRKRLEALISFRLLEFGEV